MAKETDVYAKTIDGEWLTTGDPHNYLNAVIRYALQREDYREEVTVTVNS